MRRKNANNDAPEATGVKRKKRVFPIKWSLFGYFLLFSLFIIALIWIFQILLLDTFYYSTIRSRLDTAADAIVSASGEDDGDLLSDVHSIAIKYDICLVVYNTMGNKLMAVENDAGSVISSLDSAELNELYRKAVENGGSKYIKYEGRLFSRSSDIQSSGAMAEETTGTDVNTSIQGDAKRSFKKNAAPDRLVYVKIAQNSNGENLMVVIDCPISPVGSTVSALRIQLAVISVVIVAMGILLALIISRRVAEPIASINDRAKLLASGDYKADFNASGYREVTELADTLNYASSELSKVDNLQKELIANISHDLRTPLTMIVGYAEVMRDIEGENTPENVQVIIDEANRLSALVNDILQISRYQSGKEKIVLESFDMCELTREICDRYSHLMSSRDFRFELVASGSAPVYADRKRILQVLYNLINNAINYSGDSRDITLRAISDGNCVRVDVIDRGEGIAKEDIANIWQRYYKADKTHMRSTVGSGLGLSIVREILELHGARYGVESTLGEGSDFWFELPLDRS